MGPRNFAPILALAIFASALSGCFTTQLVRTDTLFSYEVIHAPYAPPAPPSDAVMAAPSPAVAGSTWMAPYWGWAGGQYTWVIGRWIPTLTGYLFVPPRWRETSGGWALFGGGWLDPNGNLVASPPPDPSITAPSRCTAMQEPPTSVATSTYAEPPPRRTRIDHTVVLGHHSYGSARSARSDADAAPEASTDATSERASPTWITTPTYAPSRGYVVSSPSYRSVPPTSGGYATPPSSAGSGVSERTGYPTSSPSSSSSSSSSGSASFGSRTGYTTGVGGSSGRSTSAP